MAPLSAEETYAESRVGRTVGRIDWDVMALLWHRILVQRRRCGYCAVQIAEIEVKEECKGAGREDSTFHPQGLSQSFGSQGRGKQARGIELRHRYRVLGGDLRGVLVAKPSVKAID